MSVHDKARIATAPASSSPFVPAAVEFRGVSRVFGTVRAVDDINLEIPAGEFFAMLGPSGSGKTTCLRLIAGFEQPDAGEIAIFGEPASKLPPFRRCVNTVFQDYALFPHLNVLQNVAYGLMIGGVERGERERRAKQALAMVKLPGLEARRPAQLSGGQRQRVALARALVNEPKVLLLDEPLGALDLKLREEMQIELKNLQRSLGITFVFVTHDQGEALSMSDRVAIFNAGRIVQTGTPQEIYERPKSRFAAEFVGGSNVLEPAVSARFGGPERLVSLRPESIAVTPAEPSVTLNLPGAEGRCTDVQYHGSYRRIFVDCGGGRLVAALPPSSAPVSLGETVRLSWPPSAMHVLESEE